MSELGKEETSSSQSVVSSEDHEEHLRLAGVVKGVHADLRKQFKKDSSNIERIWFEHCQNKAVLGAYADAMHHLAVDHWTKNQGRTPKEAFDEMKEVCGDDVPSYDVVKHWYTQFKSGQTRIDWCRNAINEYFHCDGLKKVLAKEKRRKEHEVERSGTTTTMMTTTTATTADGDASADSKEPSKMGEYNTVHLPLEGKIRLLDVGSCFNPFLAFPEFQAIGIDISPATESVFHCDFLYLRTTDHLQVATDTMTTFVNNLKDPIDWLPRECFHVIVFSLLLEYFPAPYQRWMCCQKAHELLMYNGILVIVTPDSSHKNRNAHMMKSWKIGIQSLGFQRVRYEKQEHLHCMIFRKIELTEQNKKDNFQKGVTEDMIYIPQDFNDGCHDNSEGHLSNYTEEDATFYKDHVLHELPTLTSDSEDST